MFYIPQIQKDDCGFACLKMVLANINKDKNYLFLPQEEDHGAYSYDDIAKLGENHGINFQAVKVTEKSELINNSSYPFIVTIRLKNGANHAIVITKIKWKRVYYLDPRRGSSSMPIKKFMDIWDGTGLLIESFEKRKCEILPKEPIKKIWQVGLGIVQLLACVFAVLGVYFIKDDTPIYMPVIFLSLAIVTELLMRAITFSIMKKLDKFFFSDENVPIGKCREYLTRFEQYKKISLTSFMNLLTMGVLVIGLSAVVILNDIRNGMLVLVPLVVSAFDALIIEPILKDKKTEINEYEDDLDNATDGQDLQSKVKATHDKAYSYSYLDLACRYIYVGLFAATALLTMHLCGISSFPYIIFYTCVSASIYRGLQEIFSIGDKIEKYNVAKVKINNSLYHH